MRFSNIAYALSRLLLILSAAFVPSIVFAAVDGDGTLVVFVAQAALMAAVSFAFQGLNLRPRELTVREGFLIVSLAWVLMSLLGALPFVLTGALPSMTEGFFETMSGFTTTGATVLRDIEALPRSLLLWRSTTHWLGGVGVIALAVALFPFLGTGGFQLFKAESPGPIKDRIVPRIRDTAVILWIVYLALTVSEIGLLLAGGMPAFDAVCVTFGTVATGGFSTRNASIAAYPSAYLHYVIAFFMFFSGVNFGLHYGLVRGRVRDFFRNPELRLYASVVFIATLLIVVSRLRAGERFAEELVRGTLFQVVSIITTTGFITQDYELWRPFAQIVLLLLMVIGACSGSTGGGIKNIRIVILLRSIGASLKKLLHPRSVVPVKVGGIPVAEEVVANVQTFLSLYLLLFIAGTLVMLALGLDIPSAIGSVACTLGNVGPGLGSVGPIDNFAAVHPLGKWVLSLLMMAGRLEIFPLVILFRRSFWR